MFLFLGNLKQLYFTTLISFKHYKKNCTKNSCIQFKSDVKNVISKSVRPYWKTEVIYMSLILDTL